MKAAKEMDLVRVCLQWLQGVRKLFAWRANNVGVYDPVGKRFRSFRGLKGVADIYLLEGGKSVFIEVKSLTGKQSEDQKAFEENVKARGGYYLLVRSLKELMDGLEMIGL